MNYSNSLIEYLNGIRRLGAQSLTQLSFKHIVCLAALLYVSFSQAAFPEKPIRIVVPFAPGGAADSAVRLMAPNLQKRLGQPVLVENRAGAGATIGTAYVGTSTPDGYTLLMGSASNAIGNAIQNKMPYVVDADRKLTA